MPHARRRSPPDPSWSSGSVDGEDHLVGRPGHGPVHHQVADPVDQPRVVRRGDGAEVAQVVVVPADAVPTTSSPRATAIWTSADPTPPAALLLSLPGVGLVDLGEVEDVGGTEPVVDNCSHADRDRSGPDGLP